ncbi:MAG: AAA family ATPase [Rhodocyclales bacterium]|nr:AAA family ATPase [Rhodocyclales bacterium]
MARAKSWRQRSQFDHQAAWVFLRFLFDHDTPERWLREFEFDRNVQRWIFGPMPARPTPRVLLSRCKTLYDELQEHFVERPFYSETVGKVGTRLELTDTECRLLWLAVLGHESNGFSAALNYLGDSCGHRGDAAWIIARMIDARIDDVMPAIGPTGHLVEIGLLEPVMHYTNVIDFLNITYRVCTALCNPTATDKVLDAFLRPARPTCLGVEDFPHLQEDFGHLSRYLEAAMHAKTSGVNVLFYGIPGTGKTEFAALLAQHLDVPIFVVPEDEGGRHGQREQSRLSAFRMSQALLSHTRALVLFDDVEDGILDREQNSWRSRTKGKALLNTLLESNPVPTIWITNVADRFDPAHARRFDLVVGFKTPPRSVRVSMINKSLGDLPLTDTFKAGIAEDRDLTPAQIGKIARVIGQVSGHGQDSGYNKEDQAGKAKTGLEPLAVYLYRAMYKLRFGKDPETGLIPTHSVDFDLDWVNCSIPAGEIVAMFRQSPRLTACFHGLPGAGKTALAEHIARSLDKPLLVKRASDLLRPFLGETEMLMRRMFDEARDEGALLLLDEADSFLTDRERARQSWEVTQVNELLTQIERYRGHFIATTNAFDVLDQASLRRFDLKVRFDSLRVDQRIQMFHALLSSLDARMLPRKAWEADLRQWFNDLPNLTPGDFAVVARRMSAGSAHIDAMQVLKALRDEHAIKKPIARSIGFIASDSV